MLTYSLTDLKFPNFRRWINMSLMNRAFIAHVLVHLGFKFR